MPLNAPQPDELARPPRLVLRFALSAGLAVLVAAGAGALIVRSQATERAEREAGTRALFVSERLGRDDLARGALAAPATGDRLAELDDLVGREALGPDVSRVTLYDRAGVVTYSTDHALVGTQAPPDLDLAGALAGRTVHRRYGDGDGAGSMLETAVAAQWLLADPTWRAGVVAVAQDYAPVARAMRDEFVLQAGTLVAALLLLYLALLPIMRATTAALASRNLRLAEQARALKLSEGRYRALTEEASDAIFVCDADSVVLEANERAAALVGRSRADLVGLPFSDLVHPDDLAATPLKVDDLRSGATVLLERRLRAPDGGDVQVELHATMLEDGRILTILRDVAERKRAEAALRRAEKAESSARLAAGLANDVDAVLETIASRLGDVPDPGLARALARGLELTDQLHAFGSRRPALGDAGPTAELAGSETVLVAEDEEIVRAVVREILEEHGYAVLEAGNGREALAVAEAAARVDLLITDLVMPEMGGVELAEELRRVRPDTRIVFISGYSDQAVVPEGGDAEELTFLQKPFTHEDLTRTVREVLDREAPALV